MKQGLMVLVAIMAVAGVGFADTITNTYDGGTTGVYNSGNGGTRSAMCQSFTVEAGQQLTAIEFFLHEQQHAATPRGTNFGVTFALYKGIYGNSNIVKYITIAEPDVPEYSWIKLDLDAPEQAGNYFIEIFGNVRDNQNYNNFLWGFLNTGSTYDGGRAAYNYQGSDLLAENQDFQARFTTQDVPEPATMLLLTLGGGLAVVRRRKK